MITLAHYNVFLLFIVLAVALVGMTNVIFTKWIVKIKEDSNIAEKEMSDRVRHSAAG